MNRKKQPKAWEHFINLCVQTKDAQMLETLFDLFFTSEEKKDMSNRYLIIQELLHGEKTQREIAHFLKVSIAKITRGSNALKELDHTFKENLLKKINYKKI